VASNFALGLSRRSNNRPQLPLNKGEVPLGAEYAQLKRLLELEGLFARQPLYYILTVLVTLAALAASLTIVMNIKLIGLQLLNAVFLGFVFCQLSYVVHDAGHGQIFRSSRKNHLLGTLITSLVLGMSYKYWHQSHNRHHANPNQVDLDPDIEVSMMAFTEEQARAKTGLSRLITMYQAYFFVPMLCFDSFRRRKESIEFLFRSKIKAEIILLAAHYTLIGIFFFASLGLRNAILILFIQQASYGLFVASVFAPNHKGMPILPRGVQMGFLRSQATTTRNIRSNLLTDFWFGALNLQIEHHLFPNMPRNKLRESQPVVREFCATRNIPYNETSALDSYRQTLSYLHRIGAPLRRRDSDETESC
jgi:fatty acid desaturase